MTVRDLDVPVTEAAKKLTNRRVFRFGKYPEHLFIDSKENVYDDASFRETFSEVVFDPTMSERERDRVFKNLCSAPDVVWPRLVAVDDATTGDYVLDIREW